MHQVLADLCSKITPNGARRGLGRIRRAHQRANDLPGLLRPLYDAEKRRGSSDERDEIGVKGSRYVLDVVLRGLGFGNDAKRAGKEAEAFSFDPIDDLSDEAALDGVGLTDKQCSTHSRRDPSRRKNARAAPTT